VIIARQSTARTVTVGPVLDADGAAVTDSVVADLKIAKNGGAPAALNGSATLTHRATGHYSLALTAADLDTVGQVEIIADDTVNACPVKEITVLEEAVYDALFAASATGALPVSAGGIAAAAFAAGAIDAAALAADAGTEIATAVWASGTRTLTSLAGLTVDTVTTLTNLPAITANWLTAAGTAADFGAEIADAVWDEALAGHAGVGSAGAALSAAGSAGDPWSTPLPGAYGAGTAGFIVGTNLDALISSRLAPTTAGRTLDVTATGAAGVDWGNVENPTTVVGLTGTTISTSQVVASVTGAVGSVTGAVGSVTGAVGSVTGNVGGNVVGSVASVAGNVGGNVVGSVGSISGVTFPTNFASLGINASGHVSRVTLTDTATTLTNTVTLADASLTTAKLGTFVLAKTTNITGFNDIAATDIVSSGAITTSGGSVTLTAAGYNAAADALIARNVAGGSSTGRIVKDVFAVLRNKVDTAGTPGSMLVYDTDDTTLLWSATLTSDAAANPITIVNPG
jgi:hypothetical protein